MRKLVLMLGLFSVFQIYSFGFENTKGNAKELEIKVLIQRFDANPSNVEVARDLLKNMVSVGLDTKNIVKKYFATQDKKEYVKEYNWEIIREYADDILAEPLSYVFKNKDEFISRYSKEEVFQKLDYSCVKYLDNLYKRDADKFTKYIGLLESSEYEHKDVIKDYFGIRKLLEQKKEDEYFYKARKLFRYFPEDRKMIKEITSGALEIMNDISRLKVIQLWAGKTVEKDNDIESLYEYSKISHKVGYSDLSLVYAKKAVLMAEQTKDMNYLEKCRQLVITIENNLNNK